MGVECYPRRRCRSQGEWVGMLLLRVCVGVFLVRLARCGLRCRVFWVLALI
jgi:hypothetical protein